MDPSAEVTLRLRMNSVGAVYAAMAWAVAVKMVPPTMYGCTIYVSRLCITRTMGMEKNVAHGSLIKKQSPDSEFVFYA